MKHPNARSLARRLVDARIKQSRLGLLASNELSGITSREPFEISNEEISWAEEILAVHLDACLKQGIHPDLGDAVDEALDFARRHEDAYEPIPEKARWHCALVMVEELDAD